MLEIGILRDVVAPLGTAVILGALLGFERELRGRWAGLRTHVLVSMGAAMFVLAAMSISPGSGSDLTRVIQGITAGVGFIGAGTILKLTEQLEVKGLTTASSIWLAAAVGTAAAVKMYALAIGGTLVALLVLSAVLALEKYFEPDSDKKHTEKTA